MAAITIAIETMTKAYFLIWYLGTQKKSPEHRLGAFLLGEGSVRRLRALALFVVFFAIVDRPTRGHVPEAIEKLAKLLVELLLLREEGSLGAVHSVLEIHGL